MLNFIEKVWISHSKSSTRIDRMKKQPTLEELKQNAIDSNAKMSWFSDKYTNISLLNFDNNLIGCCCKLRRNSIFLTRYAYNTSSIITDNYLISNYESLISKRFDKSGLSPSCIQDITHIVIKLIMEPDSFSLSTQEYFSANFDEQHKLKEDFDHKNFYIFTHCIFPSIYGYFIFPDVVKNAIMYIKSFFYNNNYDFASHLICAFFENTPNFLNTLFSLYDEKKFLEDKKKSSMKYFNFFIESLEIAACSFTPYHTEIIESISNVGNRFFIQTFVENLFLVQIKLRNPKDILNQIFKFILSHEDSIPSQVLMKTLTKSKYQSLNELTISGGLRGLDVQYYPSCLSGYEMKLLLDINKSLQNPKVFKKIIESCSKNAFSSFKTIQIKVYPQFNHLMKLPNYVHKKLLIFPPFKIAVFKRVNEEYRRSFNNIKTYAVSSEIDQIMFYVPELVNPSCANKIDQVVSKMNWENQDNYLRFSYSELSNKYAESAAQFERMISFIFCNDYWIRMGNSTNSLFECQMGSFKFDKNTQISNDFALRKKLIKYNYSEIEPFADMTDSFSLAFNHICESEKEMYSIIRSKLKVMEKTKQTLNHILQTIPPYIIRRVPFYLEQFFEISKNIAGSDDEKKQYKCFFMIVFSIVDKWKLFFDIFCIFFSIFAKEVSDDSIFANHIKSSWEKVRNCFQSVVYQEAQSIEEYINNLLL